jgi:peptidoglycan hydrolase-like protein with peptidoglycan-binding domain
MGSSGDLVKKLQNDLNNAYQRSSYTNYGTGSAAPFSDLPYDFKPPLATDGQFGQLTQNAVEDFQESNNLVPDGIVGPLTWTALGDC